MDFIVQNTHFPFFRSVSISLSLFTIYVPFVFIWYSVLPSRLVKNSHKSPNLSSRWLLRPDWLSRCHTDPSHQPLILCESNGPDNLSLSHRGQPLSVGGSWLMATPQCMRNNDFATNFFFANATVFLLRYKPP